ncbi:MAG: hypothetical protein RSD22_04910 [Romboutsia sp.]
MIELDRKSIIDGIIEIQKEEELENKKILNKISYILNKKELNDLEKLKSINDELGRLLLTAI